MPITSSLNPSLWIMIRAHRNSFRVFGVRIERPHPQWGGASPSPWWLVRSCELSSSPSKSPIFFFFFISVIANSRIWILAFFDDFSVIFCSNLPCYFFFCWIVFFNLGLCGNGLWRSKIGEKFIFFWWSLRVLIISLSFPFFKKNEF